MPRYLHTPIIRAFTIPVESFDYFQLCRRRAQHCAEEAFPGHKLTNSDGLQILMAEHEAARETIARLFRLIAPALNTSGAPVVPVAAAEEVLNQFGVAGLEATLSVARAGAARKGDHATV